MADNKQDWNLLRSVEGAGVTSILVSRLIDTCDSDDYPITVSYLSYQKEGVLYLRQVIMFVVLQEDLVYLLWAFGETDNFDYHHQNRGSYTLYLLDPVVHPAPSSTTLPKWKVVNQNLTLPAKPTTYWCSIHKAPSFPRRKHHLIEVHTTLNVQAWPYKFYISSE